LLNNILLAFKKVEMKNLRTALLCVLTLLSAMFTVAQENKIPINEPDHNKPRLFDALPSRIPVSLTELNAVLDAPVGRTASISLGEANGMRFDGEVVSVATQHDAQVRSVVIRSRNYNGARLTLSRIEKEDGTISFAGRIISFQHGDLFELKNESGTLVLVKRNYHELVNE
jgi:hypothetical protein